MLPVRCAETCPRASGPSEPQLQIGLLAENASLSLGLSSENGLSSSLFFSSQ